MAFRMLGSLDEANDAVQETWLRLSRAQTDDVANLGGPPPPEEESEKPRPVLRDVSKDVVDEVEETPDVERSEELRRKVRETRERLRGRERGEPGRER